MNKYIEAIVSKADENPFFLILTITVSVFFLIVFIGTVIETYGLALIAPLLWWGYIVYKEANKDDT